VHIRTVRINGKEMDVTAERVVAPPGKGELQFHYAGLSYITPQKVQYRYKLDGYDKDWVPADTRRSAFYTNLKPGSYGFEVQACNADGVWGATATGFTVELLPHYYQTVWFVVLAGLLGIVALIGISGWRLKRLRRKQKRLQAAHDQLEAKVRERTAELAESNSSLKGEIEERKRAELEVEQIHRQLVDASRLAGQAEVASSVLHNVGNVLNSVNVSTTLVSERLQKLRLSNLAKAAQLLQEHSRDLAAFLTSDERGSRLPEYLLELSQHLRIEQQDMLAEVTSLAQNVEHIKEIVTLQQNYARVSGTKEKVEAAELMESALKMHASAYARHSVRLVREYDFVPTIIVDRHKVLQILINILQNAKYACDEAGHTGEKVIVRIKPLGEDRVIFEITDSGVGILPQNLTRIFSHGFTTRKNGHGFGLHSSALAAKEMGGSLMAHSEGAGKGATFTLELPLTSRNGKSAQLSPPLANAI
jgi:C4-dicarboxylate-specific signal transduction histidine kinase